MTTRIEVHFPTVFDPSHNNDLCDSCKGAGRGARDHYALGRLRIQIGHDLKLPAEAAQAIPLADLLARRLVR